MILKDWLEVIDDGTEIIVYDTTDSELDIYTNDDNLYRKVSKIIAYDMGLVGIIVE